MSLSAIKTLRYQSSLEVAHPPFFEIKAVELSKACVANHSHRSEHYKIFFVEKGKGKYTIDFQSFEIENSGLFFLSPGQVLTVEAEKANASFEIAFDKEFYCIETHGKEIACNGVLFNNVHRSTFLPLSENDTVLFRQFVANMERELENPGRAHREMLETYLRMFLIEALRKGDEIQTVEAAESEEENRLAGDFIALVDKHFRKKHAVSEYAELLFVSPKSLAKRLHAHGYPTPTEVIRDRIVLEAKRDLRYTQKSVKEIAFGLGFEDPAYFTRYFKKAEGASPAIYRSGYATA